MVRYYTEATKRSQKEAIRNTAIILVTYVKITTATLMTSADNTLS